MQRTFVIAEASVNHNGSITEAVSLIAEAKRAGADAVKFQLFRNRPEIEHLRLPEPEIKYLAKFCGELGIEFMCTPFYLDAVAVIDPLVKRHKVASGFLTDKAMLDAVFACGKPVIVSTGMANGPTWWKALGERSNASRLHCVSAYPCPDDEANLRAINELPGHWIPRGYSDHTTGTVACVAAVALGATIIEKHITLDKNAEGPDHACSAEPEEFAEMVRQIRRVEVMLGDGVKRIMPSEAECAKVWRKRWKTWTKSLNRGGTHGSR